MELPNCLEDYEPDLVLTVQDRRNLIKGLAEGGTKNLDKFIKDQESNRRSGIAKLVRKLRSKLDRQINIARKKIENRFMARRDDIKREQYELFESMDTDETDRGTEFEEINQDIDSRLVQILSEDDALNLIINLEMDTDEVEPGFWTKVKLALIKFFRYLKNLIKRFIAWLKAKLGRGSDKPVDAAKKKRLSIILLNFPSGKSLQDSIDQNLDNVLATNQKVKHIIDRDLKNIGRKTSKGSRRPTWQKGPNDPGYRNEAREVINQRIKRAIKREQKRLKEQFDRKKRRLRHLKTNKEHQAKLKRDYESKLKQVEKQQQEELDRLDKDYRDKVNSTVKKNLISELEDAGYVQKSRKDKREEIRITTKLIDRFAEIVLADELKKLPGKHSFSFAGAGIPHGIYEKRKLRMVDESSRMDIVDSLVNARLAHPRERHIYDSDITTHVDVRGTISHIVLIFDKSGSMEENQRIVAAKKAVLALYKAVKHRNPRNIVDFIAFDSYVHVMDLLQAWQCTPSGFTNTAEALSVANQLIRNSRADNILIYLITDGLPEAYTDPQVGKPRAGDLEKSLNLAVTEAIKLKKLVNLKFTIILLEPKEEIYTEAAKTIALASGGSVVVTDPKELATEMLTSYIEV